MICLEKRYSQLEKWLCNKLLLCEQKRKKIIDVSRHLNCLNNFFCCFIRLLSNENLFRWNLNSWHVNKIFDYLKPWEKKRFFFLRFLIYQKAEKFSFIQIPTILYSVASFFIYLFFFWNECNIQAITSAISFHLNSFQYKVYCMEEIFSFQLTWFTWTYMKKKK